MGKNRHTEGDTAVEAELDDMHLSAESKKEKKKAERLKLKAERASGSAPGSPMSPGGSQKASGETSAAAFGPPNSMVDAELFLSKAGIHLPQGAPRLSVEYAGGRKIEASSSQFSKQKAAHRFLQQEPLVTWKDIEREKCTVMMIDPDAPERNEDGSQPGRHGPWLHWILTNAKESSEYGDVVTDYQPPAPPLSNHRYIFVLFKGAVPKQRVEDRISFNLGEFVRSNNLVPVAANFFYCSAAA